MALDFESIPVIRLEVERMKHSIVHHLGLAGSQLGEHIAAEIQKAVDAYPWQEIVQKAATEAITEGIDRYFKYGHARHVIDIAVDDALKAIDPSKK